jgi:hypothetical protein
MLQITKLNSVKDDVKHQASTSSIKHQFQAKMEAKSNTSRNIVKEAK